MTDLWYRNRSVEICTCGWRKMGHSSLLLLWYNCNEALSKTSVDPLKPSFLSTAWNRKSAFRMDKLIFRAFKCLVPGYWNFHYFLLNIHVQNFLNHPGFDCCCHLCKIFVAEFSVSVWHWKFDVVYCSTVSLQLAVLNIGFNRLRYSLTYVDTFHLWQSC
jgi:hypothetical protein